MCDTSATADDVELRLLNHCLSNSVQVHYLVTSSFTGDSWQSSSLLEADTQRYMKALLMKYGTSTALRSRLVSGDSLYYLQCLTNAETRCDFVRVAAAPFFPLASAE
ncbi:hypothetical protein ABB37_00640 [Leptomonas pyrrhocoris]|uniref:Uncharacterized protein n=1 Tax=Leptomonas pyrrhocoris TaxID=157538 RepID=A0A0N0E0I5_LEPPY|nr:hypothetical protein ABB37_00640 [Leptomonas pyrrhocoris]KPA86491.1 hypothetical protein ABB37_00640 [Leptomonas pyrrhocoris]|eukprot:XP_015664930.1 hypothetical protein ABB37_00640 [Leptomonas pyrrhocoris]